MCLAPGRISEIDERKICGTSKRKQPAFNGGKASPLCHTALPVVARNDQWTVILEVQKFHASVSRLMLLPWF